MVSVLKHVAGWIYRTDEKVEDNNNIERFLVGIKLATLTEKQQF